MIAFDHRDQGTPEAAWRRCSWLADAPPLALPDPATPIVVLAAHPDDETLGAGGLLATAARRGHPIEVIVATDGAASHPESPTHSPDQLARIRQAETVRAVAELAPAATLSFLGLPDGSLAQQLDPLTAAVRSRVDGPPCWLLAPWRGDAHPDHEACAVAAETAAGSQVRLWQYPIWAWHWADPAGGALPRECMHRLPLTAGALAVKRRAIARYRSQIAPLSAAPGDEEVLPRWTLAHFTRDAEFLVGPAVPLPSRQIELVAVVVPARDEAVLLDRCLRAVQRARRFLHEHDADWPPVRVVTVLDSCRDASGWVVRGHPDVEAVTVDAGRVGAARAAGARHVLGTAGVAARRVWLANTDADSEVPVDWLAGMLRESSHGAHVVLGTALPGDGLSARVRRAWSAGYHLGDGHPHVHGANFGIRGDCYVALGGWAEMACDEDRDLARRALAAAHLRTVRTGAIPVRTSARLAGRCPGGFAGYLRALERSGGVRAT